MLMLMLSAQEQQRERCSVQASLEMVTLHQLRRVGRLFYLGGESSEQEHHLITLKLMMLSSKKKMEINNKFEGKNLNKSNTFCDILLGLSSDVDISGKRWN